VKYEINPDGVPMSIEWKKFVVGASMFIPAVNVTRLVRQMRSVARTNGIKVHHVERIENGKLGVRFWRVM
jgi:hypothetical protein